MFAIPKLGVNMFLKKHPKEFFLITFAAMALRFSFWGVGNLLVLYLIQNFQFSIVKATYVYGLFTGPASFLPIFGGIIADRWNYTSPFLLGPLLVAGGCFALSMGFEPLLYPSLLLMAVGFGLFVPSSFAILSHVYQKKEELKERGFSLHYALMNFGVFLALILLGSIAHYIGWNKAILTAGVIQILGIFPILKYLQRAKVEAHLLHTMKPIPEKVAAAPLDITQKKRLAVVLIVSFMSIFFWAAYSQGWSSISIFTLHFVDRHILKFEVPTAYFLSLESLFLIFMAPFITNFYGYLQKTKRDPSPITKITISLFLISFCFFVLSLSTIGLPRDALSGLVNPFYLIIFYCIMALGELLIGPIGPSLITQLSPKKYAGFLVGFWYLCSGVGYYLGGWLAGFIEKAHYLFDFFNFFTLFNLIPAICLLLLLPFLHKISRKG
jgi:proton-dependent oligopeptide transporter, POT family